VRPLAEFELANLVAVQDDRLRPGERLPAPHRRRDVRQHTRDRRSLLMLRLAEMPAVVIDPETEHGHARLREFSQRKAKRAAGFSPPPAKADAQETTGMAPAGALKDFNG